MHDETTTFDEDAEYFVIPKVATVLYGVPRDVRGIECECGGYMRREPCSAEEKRRDFAQQSRRAGLFLRRRGEFVGSRRSAFGLSSRASQRYMNASNQAEANRAG
jgi:hypothetical protein